jgi:hypothetical protein
MRKTSDSHKSQILLSGLAPFSLFCIFIGNYLK